MKDIELNKGNESSRFPVLKSQKVGDCFIRVTLDTRHASREGKLPVAICFHQQGKKWYYHLDMKLTGDEFVNVRRNPWVQQRITEVPRIHLSSISER